MTGELAQHEVTIERPHERIEQLLARRFGPSSEQVADGQLGLFNEAEASAHEDEKEEARTDDAITVSAHTRHRGKRAAPPEFLPRVDVEVLLAWDIDAQRLRYNAA